MTDKAAPNQLRVRMYQVGFGDCFLLSFIYPAPLSDGRSERHLLIDFGSTRSPAVGSTMVRVAESIAAAVAGKLDVLIVSHRHKDHLSAFGTKQTAALLAPLNPDLVIRPWTEDPDADPDATSPAGRALAGLRRGEQFIRAVSKATPETGVGSRSALAAGAAHQIANSDAIDWLNAAGRQQEYLHAGLASDIDDFVPGVKLRILGPPTPDQWSDVQRQRADHPDEYWIAAQRSLKSAYRTDRLVYDVPSDEQPVPGNFSTSDPAPGPWRWISARLRRQEMLEMTSIVRWLDDAINNTSLILLIEAADKRLLFGGDAQIENWQWTLDQLDHDADLRAALANIDLYKVGHHGSRNGTPKTLYRLWGEERKPGHPLLTLCSTRAGVHGETERTKVPRRLLLEALANLGPSYHSDEAEWLYLDATAVAGAPHFQVSTT